MRFPATYLVPFLLAAACTQGFELGYDDVPLDKNRGGGGSPSADAGGDAKVEAGRTPPRGDAGPDSATAPPTDAMADVVTDANAGNPDASGVDCANAIPLTIGTTATAYGPTVRYFDFTTTQTGAVVYPWVFDYGDYDPSNPTVHQGGYVAISVFDGCGGALLGTGSAGRSGASEVALRSLPPGHYVVRVDPATYGKVGYYITVRLN